MQSRSRLAVVSLAAIAAVASLNIVNRVSAATPPQPPKTSAEPKALEKLTKAELIALATANNVKVAKSWTKEKIIDAIRAAADTNRPTILALDCKPATTVRYRLNH